MIYLRKAILDANLFLKYESEMWEYDGDEYMTLPPAQTLDSLRFIPSYRIQGKDYYFVVTWGRLYLASQPPPKHNSPSLCLKLLCTSYFGRS